MRRLFADLIQPMQEIVLKMHRRGILINEEERETQRGKAQKQRDEAEQRVLEVSAKWIKIPEPPKIIPCEKKGHEIVRRRSSCEWCMDNWGMTREWKDSKVVKKAQRLLDFNVASGQHKAWLLHEALEIPIIEKTKTGLSKITPETLSVMKGEVEIGGEAERVIDALISLGEVEHLLNVDLNPPIGKDGRFHGMLNLEGTAIGRVKSGGIKEDEDKEDEEGFNELNIPDAARKIYRADEGMVMIELDMAQIQWAALMLLSRCRRGLEYYERGEDIHGENARELIPILYGREWEGRGEKGGRGERDRDITKSITHAADFGEGEGNLARRLGVTKKIAREALKRYFDSWPEVREYHREVEETVIRERMIRTPFGRIRRFFDVTSKMIGGERMMVLDRKQKKQALQFGPAAIEADAVKIAMIDLDREGFPLLTSTYDSVLMQVREERWKIDLARALFVVHRSIPELKDWNEGEAWKIRWEAKVGKNWGELKKIETKVSEGIG